MASRERFLLHDRSNVAPVVKQKTLPARHAAALLDRFSAQHPIRAAFPFGALHPGGTIALLSPPFHPGNRHVPRPARRCARGPRRRTRRRPTPTSSSATPRSTTAAASRRSRATSTSRATASSPSGKVGKVDGRDRDRRAPGSSSAPGSSTCTRTATPALTGKTGRREQELRHAGRDHGRHRQLRLRAGRRRRVLQDARRRRASARTSSTRCRTTASAQQVMGNANRAADRRRAEEDGRRSSTRR